MSTKYNLAYYKNFKYMIAKQIKQLSVEWFHF